MEELKPCRFCGESEKIEINKVTAGYFVRCENCCEATFCYDSKPDAINAWNWINKKWRAE